MYSYLIVRIKVTAGERGMPIQWAEMDSKGKLAGQVYEGDWPLLKEWIAGLSPEKYGSFSGNIILLLPGTLVTTYRLTVNASQKKHLNSVVPFLLEEHLATDLEDFHFAHQMRNTSEVDVTVAPVELLNQLIELMAENSCEPVKIVAEDQLFNHGNDTDNQATLFVENNYIHACPAEYPAVTLDINGLMLIPDQFLSIKKAEAENHQTKNSTETEKITLYELKDNTEESVVIQNYLEQHYPPVSVNKQVLQQEGGYFLLLAERLLQNVKKRTLINLRSGSFACYKRIKQHWHAWKMIAVAAGIWLMAEVLFSLGTSFFYKYKSNVFQSEALTLYKKHFPQDNSVVDVRTSLERKLRSANKPAQSDTFFSILKQVSIPEITKGKVILKIIEYHEKNNHFIMEVAAPGYEEIDNYIAALRKKGLSSLMYDASNDKKTQRVIAKLKITREV